MHVRDGMFALPHQEHVSASVRNRGFFIFIFLVRTRNHRCALAARVKWGLFERREGVKIAVWARLPEIRFLQSLK
jgi:4-aminobutyrate aminotransferase-like enzyme